MLGIDTNVLVRYLVRDDEEQFRRASRLIGRAVGAGDAVFVSLPVLLESEWVLRSRYGFKNTEILATISRLLDVMEVQFEDEPAIEEALLMWKDSAAGFADCLIGAHNRRQGCDATATFDAKALKLAGFVAV